MAITSTLLNDAIQEFAPQIFVDAIARQSMFYRMLPKDMPSSPQGPRWFAKVVGHSNASAYAEGAAAPSADEFEDAQASLDWGQYHAVCSLTGLSRDIYSQARSEFIANYVQRQLDDAAMEMVDVIDADLLGGATTNGITGITSAISDSGTYANISRSTYSVWQSTVNDNSGTPRALSMALMDAVHNSLVHTNKGNYDVVWTSPAQFDAYTALTSENQSPAAQRVMLSPDNRISRAIGGVVEAFYRGRPVIAISDYPAGRMDFVNSERLRIEILKDIDVQPLAKVNDDDNFYLTFKLQMKLLNPLKDAASLQDLS